MIDEGETDWKLFCIDVKDPLAKDMNGKAGLFTYYALCNQMKSKLQVFKLPSSASIKVEILFTCSSDVDDIEKYMPGLVKVFDIF